MGERPSAVDMASTVVEQYSLDTVRRSQQSFLELLYLMNTSGDLSKSPISKPENFRILGLARGFGDAIDRGRLVVEGRLQAKLFDVTSVDVGCFEVGLVTVSPDFDSERKQREESLRADMLQVLAEAAFDHANLPFVGGFRAYDDVHEALATYLKSFPRDLRATLTEDQRKMMHNG